MSYDNNPFSLCYLGLPDVIVRLIGHMFLDLIYLFQKLRTVKRLADRTTFLFSLNHTSTCKYFTSQTAKT